MNILTHIVGSIFALFIAFLLLKLGNMASPTLFEWHNDSHLLVGVFVGVVSFVQPIIWFWNQRSKF